MKTQLFVSYILISLSNAFGWAQTTQSDVKISQYQATEDLNAFASAMQEIHPDLFFECKEETFHNILDSTRNNLPPTDITAIDLYKHIQPLTTILGDGHTQLYFPKKELLDKNPSVFPLSVEINTNDAKIYVTDDYREGESVIQAGAQILSINGQSYQSLISQMLPYCSGERPFFRLSKINRDFTHFLYMLYPVDEFTVEYVNKEQRKEVSSVKGIPYKLYIQSDLHERISPKPYSFQIIDGNTALMTFNAFADIEKFKVFAKDMFTQIKESNINQLVIDMRMNGGGDSRIGDELFQYISPVPFQQFSKTIIKYSDLQKKLALENFKKDYSSQPNGIIENKTDKLIPLRPDSLRFDGDVYLLIGHTTFSSAGSFSWAFKEFKMGTIIGEESGGMSVCFGDIVIYRLPHSQIESTISFARLYEYNADDKNIHGTMPDIILPQEQALEYALNDIKSKREK
ncbi:MAG: S41 family peptidase [Bacteroides sp.]|nr:S41 family peptidase [Bacteroides sp.]